MRNNLIEELASYEHYRWSKWQKYLFDKLKNYYSKKLLIINKNEYLEYVLKRNNII